MLEAAPDLPAYINQPPDAAIKHPCPSCLSCTHSFDHIPGGRNFSAWCTNLTLPLLFKTTKLISGLAPAGDHANQLPWANGSHATAHAQAEGKRTISCCVDQQWSRVNRKPA